MLTIGTSVLCQDNRKFQNSGMALTFYSDINYSLRDLALNELYNEDQTDPSSESFQNYHVKRKSAFGSNLGIQLSIVSNRILDIGWKGMVGFNRTRYLRLRNDEFGPYLRLGGERFKFRVAALTSNTKFTYFHDLSQSYTDGDDDLDNFVLLDITSGQSSRRWSRYEIGGDLLVGTESIMSFSYSISDFASNATMIDFHWMKFDGFGFRLKYWTGMPEFGDQFENYEDEIARSEESARLEVGLTFTPVMLVRSFNQWGKKKTKTSKFLQVL